MNEEASLQISAFEMIQYLKPQNALIFHVPNGEIRDKKTAKKLKLMGVLPGIPDFIVLMKPRNRCGFIELKSKYGSLSPAQHRFRQEVALLGFDYYFICRSVEEVIKALWEMGVNFENKMDFEASVIELAHK